MVAVTVTSKGQIVIPSKLRKELSLGKGARLNLEKKGNAIIMKPMDEGYFDKIAGVLKTQGKLTKKLLKNRKKDKERKGRK